ncbi:hypothetical protein GFS60_06394 (plasmid) [Rhodococcus sp. WAY2]|nr:hypothetical protein GFS60_06394 [Rhodococcus sp. WAY2]
MVGAVTMLFGVWAAMPRFLWHQHGSELRDPARLARVRDRVHACCPQSRPVDPALRVTATITRGRVGATYFFIPCRGFLAGKSSCDVV